MEKLSLYVDAGGWQKDSRMSQQVSYLDAQTEPNAVVREINKLGCCVLTDVFSPQECDEIRAQAACLDRLKEDDYTPIVHPHRQNPFFLGVASNKNIVAVVKHLFNANAECLQSEYFFTRPGTIGFAAHQDNFFVQADDQSFLSAWIALTDVDKKNGGLYGYFGSHKNGRLPVEEKDHIDVINQDPNSNKFSTIMPDDSQPADIEVRCGSVIFLHSQFVHGSHANVSERHREALLVTYLKKGASYREGNYAKRSPIALLD